MHWMHWQEGWHMGGMWFLWLLAIVLIIVVVSLFARVHRNGQVEHESAESILKRRLANGEIDSQEYEQKLQQLRK